MKKMIAALTALFALCVTPVFSQISWAPTTASNPSLPPGTAITDDIWCVTYGNGTFAAVTDEGNLLTSTDGLNWSVQSITNTALFSIAYGNGNWVAVGSSGTIFVSSNLTTWLTAQPTSNQLNGVAYGGGIWCIAGNNATVITSPDAVNWTVQGVPAGVTGFLHGIVFTGSGFLLCGAEIGNGTASGPGVIVSMPVGTAGQIGQLTLSSILAGKTPSNLEAIDLTTVGRPGGEGTETVAVGWGEVVSNLSGNLMFTGTTTSVVPNVVYRGLTCANYVDAVGYLSNYWVAAGEQGTILTSIDGVNWSQRFSGTSPTTLSTATLLSAAYSPDLQRFVVTGAGGTILVSNSIVAPTVFVNVSTRGYVNSAVTGGLLDGGFVINGSAPRTVLIRADGPVLSTFGVASPLPDPVLTVYNSSGAVVATNTGWTTNTNTSAISAAAASTGAFALPNPGKDSALLLTLPPGSYTAEVTSAGGNSGIALVEAYAD